jgi:MFS family permease
MMRGDIKRLPKIITLTVISFAFYNFGWGFADPFFSLFLAQFADSYALIGVLSTVFVATSAVFMIPVGDLLDRVRHSLLINGAKCVVVVVAVLYFLAGYFDSTPFLVIALVLNGFTYAPIWAGTSATLRQYSSTKDAAMSIGLFLTSRQLAWAVGLGFGLWVVANFPIYYIFIPSMVMPLVSVAFGRGQKEDHHEPLGQALRDIIIKDKLVVRFFREMKSFNVEMWWAFGTFMLAYLPSMLATIYIPLYAESLGFSLVHIGLLVMVMNVPFILSIFSAEIADHSERIRNVVIGMLIAAVSMGALALWNDQMWHLFVAGFFLVAGYSIVAPSLSSIITVLTPKEYSGTSTAMLELVLQMTVVFFGPVVGLSIDALDWETTFLLIGVLFVLVALSSLVASRVFARRNRLYHINHPDSNHGPYVI